MRRFWYIICHDILLCRINKAVYLAVGLYIDISEDSVMKCTLSVNTGACLSPKDELAQEYLRIEHVH